MNAIFRQTEMCGRIDTLAPGGTDSTLSFRWEHAEGGRQLPQDRHRCHYVKAKVRVHLYPIGH